MKLIKPSVEVWEQGTTLDAIWSHIERCTRVCYQSTPNKNESSYDWIRRTIFKDGKPLISMHLSVLEHGTVYMIMNKPEIAHKYVENKYSYVRHYDGWYFITTNMRVIVENGWDADLYYISDRTDKHIPRYTISFITSIDISREFNRHRVHSISEESTRFCNYSKGKFGNELTFIEPDIDDGFNYVLMTDLFESTEEIYMTLLKRGVKPQIARKVLPLQLKTQVVHTATVPEWHDFFLLRADGISGNPHPDAELLARMLRAELKEYEHEI